MNHAQKAHTIPSLAETRHMKITNRIRTAAVAACLCASALAPTVQAQDEAADISPYGDSPLSQGPYISALGTGVFHSDDSILDEGYGGTLALGYRKGFYAMEIAPSYSDLDQATLRGIAVNGLLFPFSSLPNFYATIGASGTQYVDYELVDDKRDFNTLGLDAGLGYILPLSFGRYEFGIRAEARYRVSKREEEYNDADEDIAAPNTFKQTLVNIGLHLPLGLMPPPAPPAQPVEVVAPTLICSDGLDNDGDGLIDFPADPGCTGTDDGDETDPPQCSDGKDNDGDGLVDFPADKGCTGADDNDEVDPCKTPAVGERVSLKGCGLGDVIVLRGVNFEFDKDRLTVNAKTILDNVAEELVAYPEITIELGGHTDAKGSDEYNQALSDRRAASVVRYLKGKDIAAERMSSAGYGEAQPVADNETDEGRELNRRVELKITSGVAPGSTTTSDGSSTTVTEGVSTEPAVEAPAADAAPAEAAPAETPGTEVAPTVE